MGGRGKGRKVKKEERGTPSPAMSPYALGQPRSSPSPHPSPRHPAPNANPNASGYMQLVGGQPQPLYQHAHQGHQGPPPNVVMVQGPPGHHQGPPGHLPQHPAQHPQHPGHPGHPGHVGHPGHPGHPPPGHPGHHFIEPGMRMGPPAPLAFAQPHNTLESRIYDMNKRMTQRIDSKNEQEAQWWDVFGNEFFDDNARLVLNLNLDDGPKKYSIGRTLIPRYFRSIFDGGVKDLFFVLRSPAREFMPRPDTLVLEVENAVQVTRHEKPQYTEVNAEGRLCVEFSLSEEFANYPPRVRLWVFDIRNHQEFIHRNVLATLASQQPGHALSPEATEMLSKDITRQGVTPVTLNYLRLCMILEPMQNLMSLNKGHGVSPQEALTHYNFQRHAAAAPRPRPGPPPPIAQPIPAPVAEPEPKPPKRKRNRKGSNSGPGGGAGAKKKAAVAAATASPAPGPPPPNFALASHVDVMVVGEPSLMGGEFGDEDERMISRMENTQFDPALAPPPDQAALWQRGLGPGQLPPGAMPPHPPHPPPGHPGGPPGPPGPAQSPTLSRLIKAEGSEHPNPTPPLPPPS